MKILLMIALGGLVLVAGAFAYFSLIANPRVEQTLREDPDGETAARVMLITLPSGRTLPVNYYQEGSKVWAGADGNWWKELQGKGAPVSVWVRGETLNGNGRAIRDDPAYTEEIFAKLRPNAVKGFGTLVEVELSSETPTSP